MTIDIYVQESIAVTISIDGQLSESVVPSVVPCNTWKYVCFAIDRVRHTYR